MFFCQKPLPYKKLIFITLHIMSSICDPKFWSFEAQLYATKRSLAYIQVMDSQYKYDKEDIARGIHTAKQKIQVLENMIALYGPNPCNTDHFIGKVYGDRDTYYDTDLIMYLPDEYEAPLRPYSDCGTACYITDRFFTNGYNKYYVADGNGKYKFWKRSK
jgi:hypothetical protein